MSYVVIELQTNAEGAVANLVWSFTNEDEAKSKFFAVASAAAISTIPVHTVCLLTNDGRLLRSETIEHLTQTAEE